MKTVAIIQARLGSTRLPRKVLHDIAGQTMIERVVSRIQKCETIDEIMIATTDQAADQELVQYCRDHNWNCVTGSERDVLSRYIKAAHISAADHIVRITSDCPLIEPAIVDQVVKLSTIFPGIDYSTNFHPTRKFPRGLDCESLPRSILYQLDHLALEANYREHVTLYLYRNEEQFSIASLGAKDDWSHLRWTVDTPDDLRLIREIYQHFGETDFTWKQILAAYQTHPQWFEINRHCTQKVA